MSLPADNGKYQTIILIHAFGWLTPHDEGVARRLTFNEYLVIAPNAVTIHGNLPKTGMMSEV